MKKNQLFTIRVALTVALGGFLMGFDASVISGVVKFIEPQFDLTKIQLGWSVSSLTLMATLAMLVSGPISDRLGRRTVLKYAAILFTLSAVGSALAPSFAFLVIARMLGGIGVGASLIIAPVFIAEISPPERRGRLVSFNQLNIVLGISVAFFTNYLIVRLGSSEASWVQTLGIGEHNWRWMLGLETLPAIFYFFALFSVPRSPRWLMMKGKFDEAMVVLKRANMDEAAELEFKNIKASMESGSDKRKVPLMELFKPALRLVLLIGLGVAVLQQITGINSVFFYAPMIFEQSGIGTDAAFSQAILVGLTNLVFTVVAILFIDKLGRKALLGIGMAGIAIFMFVLAAGFNSATYTLSGETIEAMSEGIEKEALYTIQDDVYNSDVKYKEKLSEILGPSTLKEYESELIAGAIDSNPWLILIGILGFVASFAVSIGPVMWVLFSELFPNWIRGLAISFVGFINSLVSFSVQLVFPWELATLGTAGTFLIYGIFGALGLVFVLIMVPETKGKSLEELEKILVK
ncbi:MAG: MFS transporter [Bacteroidia bacterium]|nr:MAG: MFS transporter [Bacteroidia bacterium]